MAQQRTTRSSALNAPPVGRVLWAASSMETVTIRPLTIESAWHGRENPMSDDSKTQAPSRRRLRLLFLLVALPLVLLISLAAAGPWLAAPFARGYIEGALEDQLNAEVSLGDIALEHGAAAHLRDLRLTEEGGLPLARLGAMDVAVDLLAAWSGRYLVDVDIEDVELHLRHSKRIECFCSHMHILYC
jgi:hypothetical protein